MAKEKRRERVVTAEMVGVVVAVKATRLFTRARFWSW